MTDTQTRNLILGAASVIAIAAFLPWVTANVVFAGHISVNGMDGDGKLTLAGAVILGLAAWFVSWKRAMIPLVLLTGLAVFEFIHVATKVNDFNKSDNAQYGRMSIGIGVWLTLIASGIAFVICLWHFLNRASEKKLEEYEQKEA